MLSVVIPPLSKQNLDLIGPESNSKEWKKDFYTRIIQQTVGLNIDTFDFKDLKGSAKAKALKAFVDGWQSSGFKKTLLTDMMKGFDKVANQSLPGIVTRRFTSSYTKTIAKEAYQRMILLEVVYQVEKLFKSEKEKKAPLTKEWKEIEKWINEAKEKLTPSFSLLRLANEARLKIFGTFFENSYDWARYTVPFIVKSFFNNLINSPRRAFKTQYSAKRNMLHVVAIPLQAGFYPLALFWGGINQIIGLVARITSLPLELIGSLFDNRRLKTTLSLLNGIKNLVLAALIFSYTASYLLTAFTAVAAVSFVTAIGGGILLFAADKLLNALGVKVDLLDSKSPILGWREMVVLSLSSLIPSFTANRSNHLMVEGEKIVKEVLALREKRISKFENESDFTPANLKERQKHYKAVEACYEKGVRLLDQTTGIDFSPIKEELLSTLKEKLKLTSPAESANDPDYDKNKLVGKIMVLKSNLEKTKNEYGPEFTEQLSKINNPHGFLAAYKTKADLPAFLQRLAVPKSVPVSPESTSDDRRNQASAALLS